MVLPLSFCGMLHLLMNKSVIHVWGGLGSQLFGISLAIELCNLFPKKETSLVFHSSGITRRNLEINLETAPFRIHYRDDYAGANQSIQELVNRKVTARSLAKQALLKSGFLVEANSQLDVDEIKPWTHQYRGHYSYRYISRDNAQAILRLFEDNQILFANTAGEYKSSLKVHFRLGDLATLKRSSLVDPQRVINLLHRLNDINLQSEVTLFSDTPFEAENLLRGGAQSIDFKTLECDAWNTIVNLTFSSTFVGTNSKLSIWAAIFRSRFSIGEISYLPIELEGQMKKNLGSCEGILFY
jgi:hypothetical protein